jgi:hypothetical protein
MCFKSRRGHSERELVLAADGGVAAVGGARAEGEQLGACGIRQRGRARAAAILEATYRGYQNRRWRRQRSSDGEQLRPAAAEEISSGGRQGEVARLGRASKERLGRRASSRMTRGVALEQWSASGGAATVAGGGAVARQRRQRRKKKGGGCQGLSCKL